MAEAIRWPLKGFRERFQELLYQGLAKADWKAGRMKLPDGDNEEYIPLPPDPAAPPPAMS